MGRARTTSAASNTTRVDPIIAWFDRIGRKPFDFQTEAWAAHRAGQSGLIVAPTGMGKTLAAAAAALADMTVGVGLRLLWVTPLRALASDTVEALRNAAAGLGLQVNVELRSSDTTASVRKRQKDRLPEVLVTTPESASVLLSYANSCELFASTQTVVVDEWHELLGGKRGLQTELVLAHLRGWCPGVRVWGLTATLGNISEAAAALVGPREAEASVIIRAPDDKMLAIRSILPAQMERFPWAGHLGLRLVKDVAAALEAARTTLVFTNTRSQSELWFQALLEARPDLLGRVAIHHGSIDRDLRLKIESLLRSGDLKAVVCTSSLDLGVDFWPVEQVIQIGSPKSIGRAVQRAGRSGHQPGAVSSLLCVPTQAFELVEFSAARAGVEARSVEARQPLRFALDVLAQHVVTLAAGEGFEPDALLAEVRDTAAFDGLPDEAWAWVLDFVQRGGSTLGAYPHYARAAAGEDGRWRTTSDPIARMHRMSIGTITADGSLAVQFVGGKRLGAVEESFAARLRPGDTFTFAGRRLEFIRLHEMSVQVRNTRKRSGDVPRWMGGKLPMSSNLAAAVRQRLDEAARGHYADDEMRHVRPILEIQTRVSAIPRMGQLLVEQSVHQPDAPSSKSARWIVPGPDHLMYLYPFQGRLVHEGLAALMTHRMIRSGLGPVTATFNDYGIELHTPHRLPATPAWLTQMFSADQLEADILECINAGELTRRHFREIARIAGLLTPQRPGGKQRSMRHIQASSELLFDVFTEFDPTNLLLQQARREVLERQLEYSRLESALHRLAREELVLTAPEGVSPLGFPLWAERISSQQLRGETPSQRIDRMVRRMESEADKML